MHNRCVIARLATVRRMLFGALSLSTASGTFAFAQRVPDSVAVRAVGSGFLLAMQAGDWRAAQAFLDHEALEQFRQSTLDQAKRQVGSVTVEQMMRADTSMPRVVAEYYVKQSQAVARRGSWLQQEFGTPSADSVAALPLDSLGARWLEVHDERWLMRRARQSSNCPADTGARAIPEPKHRILGVIVGDSVAYLVYEYDPSPQFNAAAVYGRPPHIMTLRRDRDSWWVLPRSELFSTMGIMISCERLPPKQKPPA